MRDERGGKSGLQAAPEEGGGGGGGGGGEGGARFLGDSEMRGGKASVEVEQGSESVCVFSRVCGSASAGGGSEGGGGGEGEGEGDAADKGAEGSADVGVEDMEVDAHAGWQGSGGPAPLFSENRWSSPVKSGAFGVFF